MKLTSKKSQPKPLSGAASASKHENPTDAPPENSPAPTSSESGDQAMAQTDAGGEDRGAAVAEVKDDWEAEKAEEARQARREELKAEAAKEWDRQCQAGFQNYAPSLEEYTLAGYTAANYPPAFTRQRELTEEWHKTKAAELKANRKQSPTGVVKRKSAPGILDTLKASADAGTAQKIRSTGAVHTCRC